jgi:hypothetical protein
MTRLVATVPHIERTRNELRNRPSRKSGRNAIVCAMRALLIATALVRQSAASDDLCWPIHDIIFPAGSREEVITKATEFILNAEQVPEHPYWPKGSSGITFGVGWDAGYHSRADLTNTWTALGSDILARLVEAAGKKGHAAQLPILRLQSIEIPRNLSIQIFRRSLDEHYFPLVTELFPGIERLPTEVQVAMISVVFNRGPSMGKDPDWLTAGDVDKRWEIRQMRGDVVRADIFSIYIRLGTMKRLWESSGPRGLLFRRRDEQHLIRPYV